MTPPDANHLGRLTSELTGTSIWGREHQINEEGNRLTEIHIRQLTPQREVIIQVDEDGKVHSITRMTT